MFALRWHGQRDVRLDDVEVPEVVHADDVVIEVAACGICGTDLAEYEHGPVMIRTAPHALTGVAPPLTLGHEFSGTVKGVGEGVTDLALGTLVTVDPCLRCGSCASCLRGDYHLCAKGGSVGLASDGAFAELVRVPRRNVVVVPDGVPATWAAAAEPLAVGLHAANQAKVGPGDVVLVTGAGPIGIASLLGAIASGAGSVFISEPSPPRAARALAMGATEVFDPTTSDVRREVFLRSGRVGPDAAIEATGRPEALELAVTSVRRGGHISIPGIGSGPINVDLRQLVLYERHLAGSLGYNRDIERVLGLMAAGRLDAGPFLTDTAPLADAEAVFDQLSRSRGDGLKTLLTAKDS
jgi:(R,R)-butanediol dehydrogenase/meso-butanediol dehydrogenase/diacetyl reductase